jgi:hypothetical protein
MKFAKGDKTKIVHWYKKDQFGMKMFTFVRNSVHNCKISFTAAFEMMQLLKTEISMTF